MGFDASKDPWNEGLAALSSLTDIYRQVDGSAGKQTEELAKMRELEAEKTARDQQQTAQKRADRLREQGEAGRATAQARWARSNLAMSGSRELFSQARRLQDIQQEEDERFLGELESDQTRDQGQWAAKQLRRTEDNRPPLRSILSLGSSIYNLGRKI